MRQITQQQNRTGFRIRLARRLCQIDRLSIFDGTDGTQVECRLMQDAMILHICSAAEWQACHEGQYRCASLDHEGFIHCSTPEQVVEVAGRLFNGRHGLLLLVIDPNLVRAEIRYEDGGNGNFYPHVYGPLNVDAVAAVVAFEPNPDGSFQLPAQLGR